MSALKACLSAVVFLIFFSAQAQRYDSLLKKLNNEYSQEKLHVHFDRPVYNPGESIWFKAYLFASGYPSQISNTLYAELVDINGNVIQRKILPMVLSSAAASFDIPAAFNGTEVFARVYTKWMLNFDSTLIYTKAIRLTNINAKKTIPALVTPTVSFQEARPSFFVQFFPEGGDLVQGIESTVAFKATDAAGLPVDINGYITDGDGKKITSFKAAHDGMGTFLLQPESNQRYNAIWKDPLGQQHETLLNAAKPTGVTLQLKNKPGHVEFIIKWPAGRSPYPYVNIVAQMNGVLLYSAKLNMGNTSDAKSAIPTEGFPAGIMQVTLFSPTPQAIAERLVFINHADRSFITTINAALSDMGNRKKNVIEIDVPDTLLSNLSIAITDADITATHTEDNIFSQVLLTSDVRGYVHDPAYYFSSDEGTVVSHLDLVMMTNGWRRFKWEDILSGKWPTLRYMPENFLTLEGQASGLKAKQLLNKELNIIVGLKNGNKQLLNTPVLPDGKFVLPEMIFYDTAKLFYQFNKDKNKLLTSSAKFSVKTSLLNNAITYVPGSRILKNTGKIDTAIIRMNEEVYRLLTSEELRKIKILKAVEVKVRKKSIEQQRDEEYTSGFFSGGDSRVLLPENDIAFRSSQDVYTFLMGRIPGFRNNDFGDESFTTTIINNDLSRMRNMSSTWRGITKFYLNEWQVGGQELRMIPMTDVAMIKIFNSAFFSSIMGSSGTTVAVYLKKGISDPTGLPSIMVQGYSSVREFYSPDHSTNTFPDPDYRTTLLWAPYIVTDKNNKRITLSFYNNDFTRKMKVILEGCNENGHLTRVEKVL